MEAEGILHQNSETQIEANEALLIYKSQLRQAACLKPS